MKINIPNKELINTETLKRIEIIGFANNLSGPSSVVFNSTPAISEITDNETFEIEEETAKKIHYVQFKYVHKNAVKLATWYNKQEDFNIKRSNYMKIGIPETIRSNVANISSLSLETAEITNNVLSEFVSIDISLARAQAVDYVDLPIETYERCAKIQIKIAYKNGSVEIVKFNTKPQAIYRSKMLAAAQLCVRHKTSDLFEDSEQGRRDCLAELESKTQFANSLSKETKGKKNLVYYTIFFNKGYIELLNKSIVSILEQGSPNFDLLLITDEPTKELIQLQPFVKKIKPKYLVIETPVDGVEASQNKARVYEYNNINEYDKILFLDCDIVCLNNIDVIFEYNLAHDTLYTARNTNLAYWHHKTFYHGFEFLEDAHVKEMTLAQQMPFNAGQFLFRNSDRMRAHFDNVNWFMKNWAGEYFFEQAFMGYYFCKAYMTDDSALQKHMSIISTTTTTEYNITNDTCLVHFIAPPLDANTKLKFIDFFLAEQMTKTAPPKIKQKTVTKILHKLKKYFTFFSPSQSPYELSYKA